jgi:adenylate kinase
MNTDSQITLIKNWLGTGSINIFGRPFAGKDTQGRILSEALQGTLLGGGDILRGGEMPDRIKAMMRTGKLIPTQDYIDIVLPYLMHESLQNTPLILSSVGRWHGEEAGVIEATATAGHALKAVIYLDLDEAIVVERWRKSHVLSDRGERHDDTEEVLQVRLDEYRNKTLPVIEHYRETGLLIEIDGAQTPEAVYQSILSALVSRASA